MKLGSLQEGLIPKSYSLLPILVSCRSKCKASGADPERHNFFDLECREQNPVVSIASVQLDSALCCISDP